MISGVDLTLILTAIGVVAAISIPLGIRYFSREARHQLDIILDKEVFLVNQLARDVKDISILIDEKPASEQVVWITGWIVNSGSLDIGDRIVQKPLRLDLPENMSWIRANIDHSSNDVECQCSTVDKRQIEFHWTLLRSGEYIHFDCLVECPPEATKEVWDSKSFAEAIRPYSRIENTRTDTVVPISSLQEKDSPSQSRRRLMRKCYITIVALIIFPVLWIVTFFPYEIDGFFGDGFVPASTNIVKHIDDENHVLDVSISRSKDVRLELEHPPVDLLFSASEHERIFDKSGISIGEISVRDLSGEVGFVTYLSSITFLIVAILAFVWLPKKYLMGFRMRRAASVLYALKKSN